MFKFFISYLYMVPEVFMILLPAVVFVVVVRVSFFIRKRYVSAMRGR